MFCFIQSCKSLRRAQLQLNKYTTKFKKHLQSCAPEPHLPPGLTEFGRLCVGDNSLSRTRVCCSSANPPLPFSSENWLRWKMLALSDPFPSHVGTDCFGEEAGWLEMQMLPVCDRDNKRRALLSLAAPFSLWALKQPLGRTDPRSASCSSGARACADRRGATANGEIPSLQLSFTPSWLLKMPMTIF